MGTGGESLPGGGADRGGTDSRRTQGGLFERVMGWMGGHPGVRGTNREGEWRCGSCGGSMHVYKKGTFLNRENGSSMHSTNTGTDRADGPRPHLL